jgi:P-type conjugative transfer protein TrbJ
MKFLATPLALTCALTAGLVSMPVPAAGIPVIDTSNLTQNMMTAVESVTQTLKQIQQYQTQLQQYENMIQNTVAPAAYLWDQVQSTIDGLMSAVDTLNYYKTHLGSLDAYLGKFQDVAYYRSSPCFQAAVARRPNARHWPKTAAWRPNRKKKRTMRCSAVWIVNRTRSRPMPTPWNNCKVAPKARSVKCRRSSTPTSSPVSRPTSSYRFAAC